MLPPAYSYLHSRDESRDAAFDDLQYRPRHKFSLDWRWQAGPALSFAGSVVHVRGQRIFSRSGPDRSGELDPYTAVDLRLGYVLPGERVTLHAAVENLFDQDHATSYGYSRAGRSAQLGCSVSF